MTTYLDIGTKRIQQYLARSTTLAGRRGASALLAHVTSDDEVRKKLKGRATINRHGGSVDGVVSLVVGDGADPETLARDVVAWLRAELPGAEFEATWATAESYVDAYPEFETQRVGGRSLVGLQQVSEFPLARECEVCGFDPAVALVVRHEKSTWACDDCARRDQAAGWRNNNDPRAKGLEAEWTLHDHESLSGARVVPDFNALAKLAGGPAGNHLATVFIDGNAVGEFFKRLLGVAPSKKDEISRAITDACRAALLHATLAVHEPSREFLEVVPHIVGGDDVLVSVPAELGFRFTVTFLRALCEGTSDAVEKCVPGASLPPPTASAGIVFADRRYPFSACVGIADRILHAAKRAFRGQESAVMWVNVTQDGPQAPIDRRPWTLTALEANDANLTALRNVPKSAQASLAAAAGMAAAPTVAAAAVARLSERLDIAEVRPFLQPGSAQTVIEALSLAKWWIA